ncbi:MAG: Tex-like N-terminal domain-containing protein [Candidatus Hodarchaeota archaeon]
MATNSSINDLKNYFINEISLELNITLKQVQNTLELLEDGNTIPFIARYRKERTGSLDETQIRSVEQKYNMKSNLNNEKEKILENIQAQGKLTTELEESIKAASTSGELQEIYRPYKKKKKTRGTIAREKGLEPLATLIRDQSKIKDKSVIDIAKDYLNEEFELNSIEDVLSGVRDIIAEDLSNSVDVRELIRKKFFKTAKFVTTKSILYQMDEEESPDSEKVLEGKKYSQYFNYEENALQTPPHRLMAMIRGDRDGFLNFKTVLDDEAVVTSLEKRIINPTDLFEGAAEQLTLAINDSWKRLLGSSMQRELRRTLLELAENHSIQLFSENLKHLLLTPPVRERILGIDPAYRTGCKYAAIDETGVVLSTGAIYPHKPYLKTKEAISEIRKVIKEHKISIIVIGNGTASRETEFLISEIIKGGDLKYAIVSEAGASVYSASEIAREEFPNLDVTIRGAISIARRFQDPLAELVKIDPKSIGVGQYQHDLYGLSKALKDVVVDTVNLVGVNINTASEALLNYVSGISRSVSRNIIEYKREKGTIISREELNNIKGIGSRTFEQCVGFLRISNSSEPFDNSPIHPESYKLAEEILSLTEFSKQDLMHKNSRLKLQREIKKLNPKRVAKQLQKEDRSETIKDILETLQNPYRDPREDFQKSLLKSEVLSIDDLTVGMEIEGTINNVVDFGVFVDLGVKTNGLIHISEISETKFIKHPREAGLKIGDIVKARIKEIDKHRNRISLTLKSQKVIKDYPKYKRTSKMQYSTKNNRRKAQSNSVEDKKIDDLFKNGKIQL